MVLLYRQARVASMKIYAPRHRPVLNAMAACHRAASNQPCFPHAHLRPSTAFYRTFRSIQPSRPAHSADGIATIEPPSSTALMSILAFFSCHRTPVSAIIRSLKLMETWGAEIDDDKFLL